MWDELKRIGEEILEKYEGMSPERFPGYDAMMATIPEGEIGAELPK